MDRMSEWFKDEYLNEIVSGLDADPEGLQESLDNYKVRLEAGKTAADGTWQV